jgi:hypothetical protein
MQKTKRQHFVPRFYLERFVNPATNVVSVFDKFTKKTFDASVFNIAQERYFYDLQPEAIKEEHRNTRIDLQITEKALAVIEGHFAQALDVLIGGVEHRGIGSDLRWMLAVQMAIQMMRTRRYRESMIELIERFMQAQSDELVRRNFPDQPKDAYPKVTLAKHSISATHNQFFFDKDRWEQIAGILVPHIWLIAVNNTSLPFCTSDHPVVRRANIPDKRSGGLGLNSPGVELFMPVSPMYGLVLLERGYFKAHEKYDGGWLYVSHDEVQGFNRLQVEQSHRHVFSSTGDFTSVKAICANNPAVCDPNRQTVEMIVTQVNPLKTRFEARIRP